MFLFIPSFFSLKVFFLGRFENILRYKIISDEHCEFNIARYFAENTTLSLITDNDIVLYKTCPDRVIIPFQDVYDFKYNLNIKSDYYFAYIKIKFNIKKEDLVEQEGNQSYKFRHKFKTYISTKKFDEYMKVQPEILPNIKKECECAIN